MIIRRPVETVATSKADDVAYLALEDVVRAAAGLEDVRIVGGHMVSLLLTAYPVQDAVMRRTADADAAISTDIAASGSMHRVLTDAGYMDTSGNHYVKGALAIDLLVPSLTGEFAQEEYGGRGFDASPGLARAFAVDPIVLDVGVMFTDGSRREFSVRVPPVEIAVTLKAYAAGSRYKAKDYTDLYNLLSIANAYQSEEVGGWTLLDDLSGSRLDTGRILHDIADNALRNPLIAQGSIPQDRFAALIRRLVADPR